MYLPYTEGVGLHVGEDHDQEDVAVVDPGRLGASRICYSKPCVALLTSSNAITLRCYELCGVWLEICAIGAIAARAAKGKNLIRTAEHVAAVPRRCEIMLHLPSGLMFTLIALGTRLPRRRAILPNGSTCNVESWAFTATPAEIFV